MREHSSSITACGIATAAAGLCYLPLAAVDGWQSIAAIGTTAWWWVYSLATAHHLFLSFGLIGLYIAAVRRPGASGLGAFIVASTGNLLVTGAGAVQLTVLPALAAHPDGASGLDCTPFYTPATDSAAALIASACAPWQFGALEAWVTAGWLVLIAGSVWNGVEIARGRKLPAAAGWLLAGGWIALLITSLSPLPPIALRIVYGAIAIAYLWIGFGLARLGRR